MKTNYDSFCINGLPKGCQYCVEGKKSVLFLGGKCSRSCWYCSLSDSRKMCNQIFLNERPIKKIADLWKELEESNSCGIGITGGDPLVNFKTNFELIKKIRKRMGKNFHMHIYLPLNLLDESKIEMLNEYIDEIRFHPSFLVSNSNHRIEEEINKIKLASKIFGKENIGLEMPLIPNKTKEIYNFLISIMDFISFVNLNEFEVSETNIDRLTKEYSLNEDTYTVFNSLREGKKIILKAKNEGLKIKIHLCSAKTKDFHQYKNRMLRHKTLPWGNRLKNGNVIYFCIYDNLKENLKKISKITPNYFYDKERKRILINMKDVSKVYEKLGVRIGKVEEQPAFGNERVNFEWIG